MRWDRVEGELHFEFYIPLNTLFPYWILLTSLSFLPTSHFSPQVSLQFCAVLESHGVRQCLSRCLAHSSAQMTTLLRQTWLCVKDSPHSPEWRISFCVIKSVGMLYCLLFDLLGVAGFYVCLCPLSNWSGFRGFGENRSCLPGMLPFREEGKCLRFSFAFC